MVHSVAARILATTVYFVVTMTIAPPLLKRLAAWKGNILYRTTPVGYLLVILFAYCAIACAVGVNIQFAALLAGFAVVGGIQGKERHNVVEPLEAISKVSFAIFVPIYFGIIGYRIVGRKFSMINAAFFTTLVLTAVTHVEALESCWPAPLTM